MKTYRLTLVLIITLSAFINAQCTKEQVSMTNVLSAEDAVFVAGEYLSLENNQYYLNLSESQALALGISKMDYERMKEGLDVTNATINECMQNPDIIISLTDPKNVSMLEVTSRYDPYNYKWEKLPDGTHAWVERPAPSGSITTQGQDNSYSGFFFLPSRFSKFDITCRAKVALAPAFRIEVYFLGPKEELHVGVLGYWSGTISASASNCHGRIRFATTDSNGGECTYEAK